MTIEQQFAETLTIPSERYPTAYDELVEQASYDERVIGMAAGFSQGNFDFDPKDAAAVALEYGITPDDVTEYACNVSRFRLADIVRKILNDEA